MSRVESEGGNQSDHMMHAWLQAVGCRKLVRYKTIGRQHSIREEGIAARGIEWSLKEKVIS